MKRAQHINASALVGGVTAETFGGNFWDGARQGATSAALNELGNHIQENDKAKKAANSGGPSPLYSNRWGTHYTGSNNPKDANGNWDYSTPPVNASDHNSMIHDQGYDKYLSEGAAGVFLDTRVIPADVRYVKDQMGVLFGSGYSWNVRFQAGVSGIGIGLMTSPKMLIHNYGIAVERNMEIQQKYGINPLDISRPKF